MAVDHMPVSVKGCIIAMIALAAIFTGCGGDRPEGKSRDHMYSMTQFLLGQYDYTKDKDFVVIESRYADREGMYMQREAYEAFLRMAAAGEAAGLSFCILSATRSFDYQKMLWENKWNGIFTIDGNVKANEFYPDGLKRARKILEYSAMPGTSRHHWGTDIDINALNNNYFATEGKEWYDWMQNNAAAFGYHQPYTAFDANRPKGYHEEKWHWTYKPLSSKYTKLVSDHLSEKLLTGFDGHEFCAQLNILEDYVLGVHPSCL